MVAPKGLAAFDQALPSALEELRVPVFILAKDGTIVYLNPAARAVTGDLTGRHFTAALPPEERRTVQLRFARRIMGVEPRSSTDLTAWVTETGQTVPVELNVASLEDEHRVVGVFGIARLEDTPRTPSRGARELTPRQLETLQHLARGASTSQIAEAMSVSEQTVRNHVRDLMKRLHVHSRIAAVVHAHEHGLV